MIGRSACTIIRGDEWVVCRLSTDRYSWAVDLLDVARGVAIVKQSSQPVSKDDYLNAYDLNAFYAIVDHLSGNKE